MHQPKELGFWMCTALVIGNTIGMGIFVLPASLAPYGFNAMLGWGVTVLGMTMLARVFAQRVRDLVAHHRCEFGVGDVQALDQPGVHRHLAARQAERVHLVIFHDADLPIK